MKLHKRTFVMGSLSLAAMAMSGCKTTQQPTPQSKLVGATPSSTYYLRMYGPLPEERFPIPAIDLERVPEEFLRRQVTYPTSYPVGTVVVDTSNFFLYLVQEDGQAMRYGVGLGRQGFEWSGEGIIQWKRKWPTWTPPAEMIAREPKLEKWSAKNGGMPPGLDNPLGARALYIFQNSEDTLYRIHGSPEYWTIGKAVSSGCVRLMNQDVINLFERVPNESRLVVI